MLNVEIGEHVTPGTAVVELGDLSAWQILTDDLIELDVVRVQEGNLTTISIDALPELELTGKVTRIQRIGEDKAGDMTYTVIIETDQHDPRLEWNMTASVSIDPELPVAVHQ
jgi:HlyD family secretion protein